MQTQESQSFPKATSFGATLVRSKIMGPNPLKLCEELLRDVHIPCGVRVCDLGSGTGITSALLAREYGFDTYAVDLSQLLTIARMFCPVENRAFFDSLGISRGFFKTSSEQTQSAICYLRSGLGSGMPAAMAAAMIMQTMPLSGKHMSSRPTTITGWRMTAPIVEAVQTATQKTGSAPVRMARP